MVGELTKVLEDSGLLRSTWLVVTSDHGELFGEWNMVYHTASSHYQLLDIPLIVRPPGGVAPQRLAAPVQPVDVFVTLLEQAGASVPSSVGRAYRLPLSEDDPPQRTVSVSQTHGASIAGLSIAQRLNMQADLTRWLRWVNSVYAGGYLLELDSRGGRALFDVDSDPAMTEDITAQRSELVESLAGKFEKWAGRQLTVTTSVTSRVESEVADEGQADGQVSDRRGGRPDDIPGPGE